MRTLPLRIGAALACAAALLSPSGAEAVGSFGFSLFGSDDDDAAAIEIIDPQNYTVEFEFLGGSEDLQTSLRQSSALWTGREEPASGGAGLITTARGDYRALLAQLYSNGYYAGAISIKIAGREAAGISLTTEYGNVAPVLVVVDPGPIFRFGQTDIINPPPETINKDPFALTPREAFRTGRIAEADIITDLEEDLVEGWRNIGYPTARVSSQSIIADHVTEELDVSVELDPGRRATFGPATVTGSTRVQPEFIRYIANVPEGSTFDPKEVENIRDRLTDLRVFRGVKVQEAEEVNADGTVDVLIEVVPRKPRRFGIGATASSLEGLGLESFWLHRNLRGRAQRLRFDAAISGIGSESGADDYDYLLGVTYTVPGTFDPLTSLVLGASVEQNVFETYREQTIGTRVGLERSFGEDLQTSVFVELSYSEIEDDTGERDFLTVGLPLTATYDTRDDPLDPKDGLYLSGEIKPFHNLNRAGSGVRATLDARTYLKFARKRGIFALRGQFGTVLGASTEDVSPDQLFFTGGGGSIRGYEFRSVGVETPSGTVGGRSLVALSAEARYQFRDRLGAVIFTDAGLVSDESIPSGETDFVVGAGLGLRYYTGLGPLRLDIAAPLDDTDAGSGIAFYIGIGQAF